MVQKILSANNRDEVTSISDTVDSMQVAEIIEDEYNYMLTQRDIPSHYGLIQVEGLSDINKPNYLKLPEGVDNVHCLKYNVIDTGETNPQWREVYYLNPETFMQRINARNLDNDDVIEVTDFNGVPVKIETDKHPEFWTSFDDTYIVCDSIKLSVNATLIPSKTQCLGQSKPIFSMIDDYIPDIPDALFTVLYNESKATASEVLKQVEDSRAQRKSRTAIGRWQHQKSVISSNPYDNLPNFGRKIRK